MWHFLTKQILSIYKTAVTWYKREKVYKQNTRFMNEDK